MPAMSDVRRRLRQARLVMKAAEKAWQTDLASAELRESYRTASENLLAVERSAASAAGLEFADEWRVDAEWPRMGGNGVLMVGSHAAVLTFGFTAETTQVMFRHPAGVRYSDVNDEVIEAHPLAGRGLKPYGTFIVVNSRWLEELRACHSVHRQYDEARWMASQHYMLCLKDCLYEVITSIAPIWSSFSSRAEAIQSAMSNCGA